MADLIMNAKVTYGERLEREKEWTLSLDNLAKSMSGEALVLLEECIKIKDGYLVPGEPVADSTGDKPGIKRHGDSESVGLTILYKGDENIHKFFYDLIRGRIGTYSEMMNSIIIAPGEVSSDWRGIVLFHELQHVKYHKQNLFRDAKNGYWIEEQQIYCDEIKIISQLYGDMYSKSVNQNALVVSKKIKSGSCCEQDLVDAANSVITALFGAPKSKLEDRIRRGALIINIGFAAIDKLGLGTDDNYAKLIESLAEGKQNSPLEWAINAFKNKN